MKKYTDNYSAKMEIWARESRVYPVPKLANLPPFASRKFNSCEEMNAWKKQLLKELVLNEGARWTN
ncbi:MAG: hypothetical protein R6V03_04475 [Kiritimatiellia bacterium]